MTATSDRTMRARMTRCPVSEGKGAIAGAAAAGQQSEVPAGVATPWRAVLCRRRRARSIDPRADDPHEQHGDRVKDDLFRHDGAGHRLYCIVDEIGRNRRQYRDRQAEPHTLREPWLVLA